MNYATDKGKRQRYSGLHEFLSPEDLSTVKNHLSEIIGNHAEVQWVQVTYLSPETEEEFKIRKLAQETLLSHERQEYERLKKKFEG